MNISINLKGHSHLKTYFKQKYDGCDPLELPKGHKLHRKLEMLLTSNSQCLRIYKDNFLEIKLPKFKHINTCSYNKLTERGENTILQSLRNEFFADFEDFADQYREFGNSMIADSFITKFDLDPSKFDMLVKHLQRRPERIKKLKEKLSLK